MGLHFTDDKRPASAYAAFLRDARETCHIKGTNGTLDLPSKAAATPKPTTLESKVAKDVEAHVSSLGTIELVLGGALLAALALVCCLYRRKKRARRRRKGSIYDEISQGSESNGGADGGGGGGEEAKRHRRCCCCQCDALVCAPELMLPVRVAVPFILLVNIGLFVSGHLTIGAHVDVGVSIGGQSVELDSIFQFSLGNSLLDMWNAGAYALAVFIGLFSGVWPYTKLLMMLSTWMFPTCCMTPKKRGQLLMTLDTLGKWSLIDVYVLAMSMLGFRFLIDSPLRTYMPQPLYVITLQCTPVWGLYGFVLAVVSSLLTNHVMIAAHRKVEAAHEALGDQRGTGGHAKRDLDTVSESTASHPSPPSPGDGRLSLEMHSIGGLVQELDGVDDLVQGEEPWCEGMEPEPMQPEREDHASGLGTDPQPAAVQRRSVRQSSGGLVAPIVSARQRSSSNASTQSSMSWIERGTTDVTGFRSALVHHKEALRNHVFQMDARDYTVAFRFGVSPSTPPLASLAFTEEFAIEFSTNSRAFCYY